MRNDIHKIVFSIVFLGFSFLWSAPQSFNLVSPSNFSFDVGVYPALTWQAAQSAEEVSYVLQLGSSPNFEASTFTEYINLTDTVFYPSTDLMRGQIYYWRVLAIDALGDSTEVNQWALPNQFQTISLATTPSINSTEVIQSARTLTLSNSPYRVNGLVQVDTTGILNIEPGVELQFENAAGFNIQGTLKAQGTITDSIYFTSVNSNDVPGQWQGVRLDSLATPSVISQDSIYVSGSILDYVVIKNAGSHSAVKGALESHVPILVRNFSIHHNGQSGIYSPSVGHYIHGSSESNSRDGIAGGVYFSKIVLDSNDYSGLLILSDSNITLQEVVARGNSWSGIFSQNFQQDITASQITIEDNNHAGIFIEANHLSINQSQINHNLGTGLFAKTSSAAELMNNTIQSNGLNGTTVASSVDDGSTSDYSESLFDGSPFKRQNDACLKEYCMEINRTDSYELFPRGLELSFYLSTSQGISATDTLFIEYLRVSPFGWVEAKHFTGEVSETQFQVVPLNTFGSQIARVRFRRVGSGLPHYVSEPGFRFRGTQGLSLESHSSGVQPLMISQLEADSNYNNLNIMGNYDVTIQSSSMDYSSNAAVIQVSGFADISTSSMSHNTSTGLNLQSVGGVLNDLTITDNRQTGLILKVNDGQMLNSQVQNNSSTDVAGMSFEGSRYLFEGNTFHNNKRTDTSEVFNFVTYSGGGLELEGDSIYFENNTFSQNSIYVDNAYVGSGNYTFSARGGAAILNSNGFYSFKNNRFDSNSALSGDGDFLSLGGAIANGVVYRPQVEFIGNEFSENLTGSLGSAIYLWGSSNSKPGMTQFDSNLVLNNSSSVNDRYAVYASRITSNSMNANVFNGNQSGGILLTSSTTSLTVDSNTFTDNSGGYAFEGTVGEFNQNILAFNSEGGFKGYALSMGQNNIYNNGDFSIRNDSGDDISALDNWWGTRSDQGQIAGFIFDEIDNNSLGAVTYNPFLSMASNSVLGALQTVESIEVKGDSLYQQDPTVLLVDDIHYIQLKGPDSNAYARNFTDIVARNTENNQSVLISLLESENSSGQFRGELKFADATNLATNTLEANAGDSIYLFSSLDPSVSLGFIIEEFPVDLMSPNLEFLTWKVNAYGMEFDLNQPQTIQWSLWNHQGQRVYSQSQSLSTGSQRIEWNREIPSGQYIVQVQGQQGLETRQVILSQ